MALTETGFERPIQPEIAADIAADQRGRISAQLDVSESTAIGNLNNIVADRLALAHEAIEEAYNGHDPDNATDDRLVALALLTGTVRRDAQAGTVTMTCNLNGSLVFQPGDLVVHANNDPENRWLNRDVIETTTTGAHTGLVFVSDGTGSDFVAAAGTLTVIASPVAGFNSATNPEDATPGRDLEDIEDLRVRREAELALGGAGTVDVIRADVLQVEGVIDVLVEENTSDSTVGDLPPHSIRVVVWDGDPGLTADNDIAQAVYGTAPAGIFRAGTESGTAVRDDGSTTAVAFERVAVVELYVEVDIVSAVGVSIADVKAALVAAVGSRPGADVIYNKLTASVFIDNVDDFTTLTLGTAPSPVGTSNITISNVQLARLQLANITVTGDAS